MANPHLVPKQVVDKNGVQTTRWVKPSTLKESQIGMPSPSLSSNASSAAELMREASVLLDHCDSDGPSKNILFLGEAAPEKLESIVSQCNEDDNLKELWGARMRRSNMIPFDTSEDEYLMSLNFYERHIAMYPLALDIIRHSDDYCDNPTLITFTQTIADTVTSLLMHGTNLGSRREREFPSDDLVKALTIVTSVRGMYSEAYWRMDNSRTEYEHLADDAAFISEHVDEVLPLVPLMIERKSHDRGWLAGIIDGKATALSSGAL